MVYFLSLAPVLLATSAFASPAIQKRGIRSPAHRFIPSTSVASRDTGAAQAITDGGGWVLPALIGEQQVYLHLETGSSDLWTASTLMPEDQQSTITRGSIYDPCKSSTYTPMHGSDFSLGYADGSGASGPAARDTVNIGGAMIPDMPFGVCDDLRYGDGSGGTRATGGPLGLGFGSQNSIRPTPQCTFMECLEPYVPEPIFSTSFKHSDTGFIDFGFADTEAYSGHLTEVPAANTSSGNEGRWISLGVQFGSRDRLFSADPLDLDFDSGTASLSLSEDIAAAYFKLVNGAHNSSGSWQYPCEMSLPNLQFTFSDVLSGPETVTIPGENIKKSAHRIGTCSTWIDVVEGRGNAGLPFFVSKYIIWNQAKPSLSFADQGPLDSVAFVR